ncbi:MAG: hypothetical protein HQL87_07520 [Magnetococcales bacterium]|nr:hypothetical protein [Magnetococcales bacterium]
MKKIALLIVIFSLLTLSGPGYAGSEDEKAEFKPNFMYGTSDGVSPDYQRAAKWLKEITKQGKESVKKLIGMDAYNKIAYTMDSSVESVKSFFDQFGEKKRFEWKVAR